ncbi:MAG: acetylglucosamine-6-sulfatase, partial [bacterium]
ITYYGLWDVDEIYDLQSDPGENRNLVADPQYGDKVREMEDRIYAMLGEEVGMEIPMNQPRGSPQNKRWRVRGGQQAADFPDALIVDEPINRDAK